MSIKKVTTTYVYDEQGRVVSAIRSDGNSKKWTYTDLGQIAEEEDIIVVEEPAYPCEKCGKEFKNNAGLGVHRKYCNGN
jgi:hypothetical protein